MTREWCAAQVDDDEPPMPGSRPIDSRHGIHLKRKRPDRHKDHRR
jgi:hypothetical protein